MSGRIEVVQRNGSRLLLVEGVVQSVAVDENQEPGGFWPAMLPERRPRRALILGLGGGTLVYLLRRRFGPIRLTGVDDDAEIMAVARASFGLGPTLVRIVEAEAGAYLRDCAERFDLVLVDLFRGEELPPGVYSHVFLRRLRAVLEPGGTLVWNLHRDRRGALLHRRLRRALLLRRRTLVGLNLILHLRRRARRRWAEES